LRGEDLEGEIECTLGDRLEDLEGLGFRDELAAVQYQKTVANSFASNCAG
jgi:hypothetical protein